MLSNWQTPFIMLHRQCAKRFTKPANRYDIVFLDPPYQADLLLPTCCHLEDHDFLAPIRYIYLEAQQNRG